MRAMLRAPWRLPGYLRHLYRRRISVQLIVSHLLVMVLTAAILEFVGVVIIAISSLGQISPSIMDFISLTFLVMAANVLLLGAIGVAVLLASIPVSVWTARTFSKRLSRAAQAAEAMALGDLSRRVDVTGEDEISQLAVQFNDVMARLEQADRSRKAFVANVSHELRTPLAIIQGNLERLLEAERVAGVASISGPTRLAEDPVPDRQLLETIQCEALTLNRLIDDLFTLARLEEAVLPLESTPLRLDELVTQAVEGVRSVAWTQRKVTVQSLVREDLPPVLADRIRLGQILGNLLHNALRYTPEGGLVIVDAVPAGDVVEVSVSDTGIGIPAEELGRVFDRFYQVEHGGREPAGSGLGLSIVKQLVEAQHGTVTVESHPGQGTTFRFSLPVAAS